MQAAWGLGHIDGEPARAALVRVACHGADHPQEMAIEQLARDPRPEDGPVFAKLRNSNVAKRALFRVDEDLARGTFYALHRGAFPVPSVDHDDREGPPFPTTLSRFPEYRSRQGPTEFWEVPPGDAPDVAWKHTSIPAVLSRWDELDARQQERALEPLKYWMPEIDPPPPATMGPALLAHLADPEVHPAPWVALALFADPEGVIELLRSGPFHEQRLLAPMLRLHTLPPAAVPPLMELLAAPRHASIVVGAMPSAVLRPHLVAAIDEGRIPLEPQEQLGLAAYPPYAEDVDWLVETLRTARGRPPPLAPDVATEVQRRMLVDPARAEMSTVERRNHTWRALDLDPNEAVLTAVLADEDLATVQGALEKVPARPPDHQLAAALVAVERCVAAGDAEARLALQLLLSIAPVEAFERFGDAVTPGRGPLHPLLADPSPRAKGTLARLLDDPAWEEQHEVIAQHLEGHPLDEATRKKVQDVLTPRWSYVK